MLRKLNDQMLFDATQLTGLVSTLKAGDTVTLSVQRNGKATPLSATLTEKEQPKMEAGGRGMMSGRGMPGM